MRKKIIVSLMLMLILHVSSNCYAYTGTVMIKPLIICPNIPPEKSQEELYQDVFMTLLWPYIKEEVDKYYEEYLLISPNVALYDVKILEAYRVNGYRGFDFRLKIELHPYVGAHLYVGIDYITIRVSPIVKVKIEKFEHIESYELPPNHQNIIKL